MTHAITTTATEQPTQDAQGRIYGATLPPSKRIDVRVRFWREDDPEVWSFAARPKLDVTSLRRVGGLMKMAEIQQYRDQSQRQAKQAAAQAQLAGKPAPAAADAGADVLPREVIDSVDDILRFVGGMMTDRDGVPASWDPDPTPHTNAAGAPVERGKDVILPPADSPSWARTVSVRMPDGTIVPGDDPRVAEAQSLEHASSKRRWRQLVELDDDVELGLDAIMELVGDLVGQWAGSEDTPRPLDEQSSSGSQPSSAASENGSAAGSPSPV